MNRVLLKKTINEAKLLFIASALLLFSFCWIRVWIVSLLEMPKFATVVEQLWDKWGQFSPVSLSQLLSYPGRIALTYIEPIVVFTVSIWAIARGSDSVSGELGRGTMEMLLGQPISRLKVLWTHAGVTIAGIALLAMISWCGVWVGIQRNAVQIEGKRPSINVPGLIDVPIPFTTAEKKTVPMSSMVDASVILPATFNLFAMGFCVAGLATLMSSWDRYRWRTIGIVSSIYIVQFIIKGLAMSTAELNWMRKLTFFTAYEPQAFVAVAVEHPESTWSFLLTNADGLTSIGPLSYNSILLGIGLVSYIAATIIFCRRDLPAPL